MNNIDIFNIAVGQIFKECYISFPIPTTISKGVIGHEVVHIFRGCELDVYNHDDLEFKIAHSAILWLLKAGYLWSYNQFSDSDRTFELVLSPKGLEILNAIPKSLSGTGSIGERLSKGASEIGFDIFKSLAIQALSTGASRWFAAQ